jgi:hypothetical protein
LTMRFRPQLVVVSGHLVGTLCRWDLGHNLLLSQAFSVGIPLTMGFRLSRSLFHELFLFSQQNSGCQEAFFTKLFLFHDGILAIKEPFTRTFLFHDGILAIKEPFTQTFLFHDGIFKMHDLGEDSFHIYIYITKSIYIGSSLLKTLPLDLEPLCKEKSTVLLILMQLRKGKLLFFPEITYRHVIRLF